MAISQEVADGVNASAQVVQAAEAKLRQFSSMARQQTECMYTVFAGISLIFTFAFSPLNLNYTIGVSEKKVIGLGKHT